MWINVEILLCCIIATTAIAANEARPKKKDDPRGKRNLEYSISHHVSVPNYRSERRIATVQQYPQIPQYPLYFPQQKYAPAFKGRPDVPTPPYAVQMEPLVHYSQRDPLYDLNSLTFIGEGNNDIKNKEDLLTEHSHHVSRSLYNPHEPVKQIVERPVYIKEPEPIIEIIIKESNITLPPLPTPPPPPPRKKEQVHVFYVKYKKNPNGYGKDSIVYDKPVPALSPHIPDEPVQVEPPATNYEVPATYAPPPSTTLRAIVKPDSESYHADKGIHITFGKQENDQYKRSNDDANEESAPEPAISRPEERPFSPQPQGRQFIAPSDRQFSPHFSSQFFQKRPPGPPPPIFNNESPNFKSENIRFPPHRPPPQFRPLPQFGRQFLQGPSSQPTQQLPSARPAINFQSHPFPQRGPPHFSQQIPESPQPQLNSPVSTRQPVPYQPFEQLRPQQSQAPQSSQIQFPRPHTHFPVYQQLPLVQNQFTDEHQHVQATQQQFQNNLRNEELFRQQQFRQPQVHIRQQLPQHQFAQPFAPQQEQQQHIQQQHHQQQQQPLQHQQQLHHQHQIQQQEQHQLQHNQQYQQQQQQQHLQQQQPQLHQQHQLQSQTQKQQFPQQFQHALHLQPQQPFFGQQPQSLNNQAHAERVIPPGGELIQSVPKYEQHISVPVNPGQPQIHSTLSQPQPLIQQRQPFQSTLQHIQSTRHPEINVQINPQDTSHQNQQLLQQTTPSSLHVFNTKTAENHNYSPNLQHRFVTNFQQNLFSRPPQHSSTYQTTPGPIIRVATTTQQPPSPTTSSAKPSTQQPQKLSEADLKDLNIELPDEVPDELRQQLLSSGILKNAQISVLDYDKVGDIPLSALPPEQLANFYGAGGGQQIAAAGSEHVSTVVNQVGQPLVDKKNCAVNDMETAGSEVSEVKAKAPVEMKVVHFDPETEQGREVQKSYVKEGATQVEPVALDDQQYNRYLPVKVNGAAFPIPDVPELKGRNITSVVILAPVDYNVQENVRTTRDVNDNIKTTRQQAAEALKVLIKNPNSENFKDWLDKENNTIPDKQAVILLVTGNENASTKEKEIFMYDVGTKTVSQLSGELSSAFVDAAETNSNANAAALAASPSNLVETRVPYPKEANIDRRDIVEEPDLDDSASEFVEAKIPLIDPTQSDNFSEASEQLESFVDVSGIPIQPPQEDLAVAASDNSYVSISSGYSKTGSNLFVQ